MSTNKFFPSVAVGWDRLHAGPLAQEVDDFAAWEIGHRVDRRSSRMSSG